MAERIPQAELEAARLKFKRRLAATLIGALAESNVEVSTVEQRLEMADGMFLEYITSLVHGRLSGMDDYIDIATALGFEITVSMFKVPSVAPVPPLADWNQ